MRVEECSLTVPTGCVAIADPGSRAVLTGNVFHSIWGPAVQVHEGGGAILTNNVFLADAPFMGVAQQSPESRIYGLDIEGHDAEVEYANNWFHASHPGTAIRFRDGAADRGGEGNVFRGGWDKRREASRARPSRANATSCPRNAGVILPGLSLLPLQQKNVDLRLVSFHSGRRLAPVRSITNPQRVTGHFVECQELLQLSGPNGLEPPHADSPDPLTRAKPGETPCWNSSPLWHQK